MPERINRPPTTGTTSRIVAVGCVLVALDLLVFAQVVQHDFISLDDSSYVTDNPMVQYGLTGAGVIWAFTTNHAANWHPLTWLSHMLDADLFGMSAGGHHATSLVLHVVSTLLLFLTLHRLTGALGRSAFVAALFGVHPLHVESVAWVAERKDVLSTCFWWLTIWAYAAYVRRPARGRYALVVVALSLGLLAKPMLVTAPIVLLLLDVWPLGRAPGFRLNRAWWLLIREKWPLFAVVCASVVITVVAQRQGGAVAALGQLPVEARVENAALSYVAYLGKAAWPAGLSVFYEFPHAIPLELFAGACVLLAGITVLALRLARRHPYVGVGWLWYLVTLVPVVGFVQVGSQGMADRYTYVPLVGIFIAFAWGISDLTVRWRARPRWALPAAATAIVVVLAIDARAQVGYWADDLTLWTHAAEVEPQSALAHANLGGILGRRQRWDDALPEFERAHTLNPELPGVKESLVTVLLNRGLTQASAGRMQDALSDFGEAVRLQPDLEVAHFDLGQTLRQVGRVDDARREFREVLRLNPGNDTARKALSEIGGLPG
jgi:protein O-mannosyl-transferase